ncbi:hypothetical protein COY43_00220 [Candidatus Berkelbacteria bacterium CG_4_10_14_0_8_um_filter_35_9_33_8]|uniref:Uncharacterized protein n=1 Tax=Candidatus Berkelbacteria bacterium CG_4_10_14_0_2_um_filter_35_9_33_12 TaxID=1974499 RepID=A0A2M7W3P0_9BACT|nr:MAG: hypothetical protein COX10_02075 [Candidatus Berkelbacteria bacterium CG23_combo_of_CG06-09_8_20_14_all_33_15]PIZ28498.1 MAG: hypothetical protein COY43_00220 [Candidatus Berkelbacteria bacterium CG_4_10_14_0_8_um_filter_35_9_33_8]PJA20174.1 MAG: hypothetical protein COX60_02470 [Candidatus Berkelbacteria bacterium CG_4_10_14_0_2_um_filter_35_9_33_12]
MLPTEEEKAQLSDTEPEEDEKTDDQLDEQPSNFGENIFSQVKNRFNKSEQQKTGAKQMANKLKTAENLAKTAKNAKTALLLLSPTTWAALGIGAVIIVIVIAIMIIFANLARDPADGGKSPAQEINTENSLDQKEVQLLKALNSASTDEELMTIVSDNKNIIKHIAAILVEQKIDIEKIPTSDPPKTNKKEILDEITQRINNNLDAVSTDLKKDKREKIFTEIRTDLKTLTDYATQYPKTS